MDWPTREQISQIILDAELPSTSSRGDPAWLRAADAILALFEPLRTEADGYHQKLCAEIERTKVLRAELEALRPVARAALIEHYAPLESDNPKSAHTPEECLRSPFDMCAAIRALPADLLARALKGA
jgi:hypothetical protein